MRTSIAAFLAALFLSTVCLAQQPVLHDVRVQLRAARVAGAAEAVASHCWFVTLDLTTGEVHRWEVFDQVAQPGRGAGHVHVDARGPDDDHGGGGFRIIHEWQGEEAMRLIAVLRAPEEYPWRDTYNEWPGPNSNTYAAWVLRRAEVPGGELPPEAVGKDFAVAGAGVTTSRTGVQLESPIVGTKLGLREGVEGDVFGMTFGVGIWPPSIKLPFGRIGPEK